MIYFVRARKTGHIKIGCTIQFKRRAAELKAQHGDIDLLGVMPGGRAEEKQLHQQFKHLRLTANGFPTEWHLADSDLLDFIKAEAKPDYQMGIDDNQVEDKRRVIMWSRKNQQLVEKIIARHAGRMGELGIATRSKVRPGGEVGLNRSGAIMFALMLAAGEVDQPQKDLTDSGDQ